MHSPFNFPMQLLADKATQQPIRLQVAVAESQSRRRGVKVAFVAVAEGGKAVPVGGFRMGLN
jgi:hypothetical protein